MASTRLQSIATTETLLDETVSVLQESPTASESGFRPFNSVQKFSGRLADLDRVLSAAKLPAAVVTFTGSTYQTGRAPVRKLELIVVVRWPAMGDREEQAKQARAQMDAMTQRLDQHVQSGSGTTAVWHAESDMQWAGKDGSNHYAVRFSVHDH